MGKPNIQYAALPYRVVDGHPQVLLVTSRETKRWILPKGKPEKGLQPWETAAQEAFEEAGLLGEMTQSQFASYMTVQRTATGQELPVEMRVYVMRVTEELDHWPEKHERERRWVAPGEAAMMASEGGLVQALLLFGAEWE